MLKHFTGCVTDLLKKQSQVVYILSITVLD